MELSELLSGLSWQGNRYIPLQWTPDEIHFSRRMIRTQILIDRGGRYNATSILGGNPANHYHEIINRARTPEYSIARWLSYQPEVCAILTASEHITVHNTEMRNILFQHKYNQYGYEDVQQILDLINSHLYVPLDIRLPEPS
jgi:hypothetical protein